MKNICIKIIGIFIVAVILLNSNVMVIASTQSEINDLKNQKNENDNEKEEIQKEKEKVSELKNETVKQVEELSDKIYSYQSQINELDEKINDLNSKISETQNKLDEAQKNYESQEKLLEARLVASYEAGDTSYLDFILSSESITDLISNYYLVTELATYDAELLEKIEKQKQDIENAKKTLEDSKKELDTSKISKQSVATQLQNSKNEKNKYIANLSDEEKKLQAQIDEISKANDSINQTIKKKKDEINRQIEEDKRQQQQNNNSGGGNNSGGSSSSGTSSSGFIKPVNSYITTGLYYSSGQYHGAVDYGASGVNGMPVYAVADGIVVTTQALTTSYGNYIIIAHYNGLYTLYAHGQAGSICVRDGQKVKKGQQIMKVGSTGNSSGPHLHFEVRTSPGYYSNRVDPRNYLPK